MAYRYLEEWFETDDVVTPADWLKNAREYTNEFNGALDRDNLPDSGIDKARIASHAFTEVDEQVFTAAVTPNAGTTEWQTVTTLTYDTESDPEVLQCEFSCWWSWVDVTVAALAASTPSLLCERGVRFRIAVDGVTIATSNLISRWHRKCSVYLVGCVPVPAGRHDITADVQVLKEQIEDFVKPPAQQAIDIVPDVEEGSLLVIGRRR